MLIRQGDLLLVPVAALPAVALTPVPRDGQKVVLAYGETTGHSHSLLGKATVQYTAPNAADAARQLLADAGYSGMVVGDPTFLDVPEPDTLTHDEHTAHPLHGTYVVIRQTEWSDANEPIAVRD